MEAQRLAFVSYTNLGVDHSPRAKAKLSPNGWYDFLVTEVLLRNNSGLTVVGTPKSLRFLNYVNHEENF